MSDLKETDTTQGAGAGRRSRRSGGGAEARRAARGGKSQAQLTYIKRQIPLYEVLSEEGLALIEQGRPAEARAHFDAAESAVRAHSVRADRVRTARLPLMYAELEIAKRRGATPGGIWEPSSGAVEVGVGARLQPRAEVRELLDAFLVGCAEAVE